MTDPVRATLERQLEDAEQRVASTRGAVIRMLAGGVPLCSDRIAAARGQLTRALAERTVARELLRELHAVDGEPT
ncbi:MAG: hypothetical protein E6J90_11285 [Deltaproteobacteria bacterium]|nr:MAG: hypothetical protein E6J91_19800 [Deltaproteobacteria bacterium]TMQ23077.1 MAG: hypothetical protein E6J90_11285 [Deltaproteobacteria bacterium]